LSTELPADQIAVALKQSCRADVKAELVAHDPLRIPQLRIYEMTFASLEERDRLLIALRQREQGQKPAQRTVAAAPRMVRMEQRRRA
jgi:hypothetical protein